MSWKKAVEPKDIIDGKLYFLAMKPINHLAQWVFYSELKSGERRFTVKPGIALQYEGSDELRKAIDGKDDLCAVEVPSDASKRWRAKK